MTCRVPPPRPGPRVALCSVGPAWPGRWPGPHRVIWIGCAPARQRGALGKPLVPASVASPRLGDELFARLLTYGTPHETHRGDVLFRPGDEDVDLIVVDRGSVEVVRTETADVPAATVAAVDAGGFVGELNLLTGQNVYLLCRVRESGTVYRVSPERLRQLMANDVELSDIVFKALIARRELLQRSTAALAVEIVGTDRSAAALALRTYAARQRLIHLWFDADTPGPGDDGVLRPDRGRPSRRRHARRHAETGHAGRAGRQARPQLPSFVHQAGQRRHRRRGSGRSGGRSLRLVRGPGHRAAGRRRHRRAGRGKLPGSRTTSASRSACRAPI